MAAPWTKASPLETYLNTVTPVSPESESEGRQSTSRKSTSAVDQDWQEGARAVILTILSNTPVLSDTELRKRSEFAPELYDKMLGELTQSALVEATADGYSLTDQGRLAARRERDRLLGML